MSSMPQGAIRRIPPWQYAAWPPAVVICALSLGLLFSASWDAYAHAMGTTTTITVQDPCDDNSTAKSDGDDDCRATWTTGGRLVDGTVHLQSDAVDGPPRPYQREGSVLGGQAYVKESRVAYWAGLLAPWLLILDIAAMVVLWRIDARRERRRKAVWRAWKAERDAGRAAG